MVQMIVRPFIGGRRFLVAGFGGLLALMLVAGADALLVLRKVRTSDTQMHDMYLKRSQALDQVRSGVYQSAIVMRDYLLARDHEMAHAQVEKWTSIRQHTDAALKDALAVLDPAEAAPFRSLEAEVQVYWKLLEFISEVHDGSRPRTTAYFSNELVASTRSARANSLQAMPSSTRLSMRCGSA
jgi:hypothetical protein